MDKPDENTPPIPPDNELLIDAGRVILMMKGPDGKPLPIPLPELMNQIFEVLKDHDQRLPEAKEESRIIRV